MSPFLFSNYEQTNNAVPKQHSWDGHAAATKPLLEKLQSKTEGDLDAQIRKIIEDNWLKPHADDVADILTTDKQRIAAAHEGSDPGRVDPASVLRELNSRIDVRVEDTTDKPQTPPPPK